MGPRHAGRPWVRGPQAIRSYAACPVAFEGLVVGTVCVLDPRPRALSPAQRASLGDVAGLVEAILRTRCEQQLVHAERQHAIGLVRALAESEAMLSEAQRVARMGSWEIAPDGAISWSPALFEILGQDLARGPLSVEAFAARIHPEDVEAFEGGRVESLERQVPHERDFRFVLADGRAIWLHAVSRPVRDAAGRVTGFRGTVQDVTERKDAERRAREAGERDRLLWQTTTDVVLFLDEANRIQFCNPAVRHTFGHEPEDLLGRDLSVLQPLRKRAQHEAAFARYLRSGERRLDWRTVETVAQHRDGREFPVEISFSDMVIDGHRVFGAFLRDVSARVGQQQALRLSEERYRRIVQTAAEGIWTIDADSVTTFVNPTMAAMLGYAAEEMVGRPLFDFMREAEHAQAQANVERRRLGIAEQHDFRLRRKDGSDVWTAMSTTPAFDGEGRYAGALAMVTDITERRRAEDALRESEARFRSLTELSSDWYWEQDEEFRLTKVVGGRAFEKLAGFRRHLGQRPWEAPSDGMAQAQWDAHRAQLEAHEPFRDFEITRRGTDGTLQIVSVSGEPQFGPDGVFRGYRGVGRDVTEQRRAQVVRQELEAQLRESQKMEAIGVLAGGIAHDFNNVLAGILGNVALAAQDLAPGHPAAPALEQIRKASLRGRELVQQILAFARRQPREITNCELRPLVEESLGLLRATLPAGVTLESAIGPRPLHVLADATQVEQVLMNLCTNAWHALDGRPGRIAVTLDEAELSATEARRFAPPLAAGRYARLAVQDDGQGMDAATRARIFEPFFTTKEVGEGTGLGLAVAHGIVAAHGGAIRVESAKGRGSLFEIFLPAIAPAPGPARPTPLATTHRGRGERVLYIDDDEVMVTMVERLLERSGYAVACMHDPAAAIAAVRGAPGDWDIVVTDLNMPQLSGLDVARALRAIRADLPVVISSGNLPDQLQADARQAGVRALLHKQYTLEELGAVIHWVLAGGQRLGLEPLHQAGAG